MSWEDSKYGVFYDFEKNIDKYSGINRTGLLYGKTRYFNGQHCKGFELDRKVMFSEKNDYKEEE